MSHGAIRLFLCLSGLLVASWSVLADNPPLGRADLKGKICCVTKVDETTEKDPTVGFIMVGKFPIRVTHSTSISMGPSDLVFRGFGSLKKGATVEVVFIDATAEDKTAKEINILKDPAEKESAPAKRPQRETPAKSSAAHVCIGRLALLEHSSVENAKSTGFLGYIRLEGTWRPDLDCNPPAIAVNRDTHIVGSDDKAIDYRSLRKGDKVVLVVTGDMAKSPSALVVVRIAVADAEDDEKQDEGKKQPKAEPYRNRGR